jgi:hypothetical protein
MTEYILNWGTSKNLHMDYLNNVPEVDKNVLQLKPKKVKSGSFYYWHQDIPVFGEGSPISDAASHVAGLVARQRL